MGRHANADSRRRLAAWPIVVAVVVLVLAGLTVAYFVVTDPDKKTAACTGRTVLPVTASPGAAKAVTDAAAAFNATAPVARSTCVSVSVSTMSGPDAAMALTAGWKGQTTAAPGLWVVDSSADIDVVDTSAPALTAGHANAPIATSPVVLAVRVAPTAAVSWSEVARGTSSLVLDIPDPQTNRASTDALESMVAGSNGTTSALDSSAVTAADGTLYRLAAAAASSSETTTGALAQLAAGSGRFTAVPVMESQLASYNQSASAPLAAVYPTGPTAGDEILPVPLTADWVSDAMSDAAAAFDAFLGDAEGMTVLNADHLRTSDSPGSIAGVDLSTKITALPQASTAVRNKLLGAWSTALASPAPTAPTSAPTSTPSSTPTTATPTTAAPTTTTPTTTAPTTTAPTTTAPTKLGPAISLVLDTSGSMDTVEGKLQRIMWMQSAVNALLGKNPTDLFGLWSFSTDDGSTGYRERVPLGPLSGQVNGGTRAAAITAEVNALTPGGDSWTYGAIKGAYTSAINSAQAGRPNRVIVVTDGADTTPSLSRAMLEAEVAALAAQNQNVVLDIVGLSTDVDAEAMTEIATAGRGRYTQLTDLSQLQATLTTLATG